MSFVANLCTGMSEPNLATGRTVAVSLSGLGIFCTGAWLIVGGREGGREGGGRGREGWREGREERGREGAREGGRVLPPTLGLCSGAIAVDMCDYIC